jgi:hypothetical protein
LDDKLAKNQRTETGMKYVYDVIKSDDTALPWHLRNNAITAVCDAVEGFCEDVCGWYVSDLLNTVKPMCHQQEYLFRSVRRRQMYVYCPHCNRRVVEQFDILKEEGV